MSKIYVQPPVQPVQPVQPVPPIPRFETIQSNISWGASLRLKLKKVLPHAERIKDFVENAHILFMVVILILIIIKLNLGYDKSMMHYKEKIAHSITYSELVMYPIFLVAIAFIRFYEHNDHHSLSINRDHEHKD